MSLIILVALGIPLGAVVAAAMLGALLGPSDRVPEHNFLRSQWPAPLWLSAAPFGGLHAA